MKFPLRIAAIFLSLLLAYLLGTGPANFYVTSASSDAELDRRSNSMRAIYWPVVWATDTSPTANEVIQFYVQKWEFHRDDPH